MNEEIERTTHIVMHISNISLSYTQSHCEVDAIEKILRNTVIAS